MPNGDYRKLAKSGDDLVIPAAAFNEWQEAAAWVKAERNRRRSGGVAGESLDAAVVSVKNTTSAGIAFGGVVGLNALIVQPSDGRVLTSVVFEAAAPTADNITRRQIAVLAEPANPGNGLAKAYVSGIFPAIVNVSSDGGDFARVDPGNSDSLVAGFGGGEYRILWITPGTGEQWALVTPNDTGPFVVYLFKDGGVDGSLTSAATWTYTAKTKAGDVIATSLTPQRVRRVGRRSYAADNSRGLAEWDAGTLILLDAYGEFEGVNNCTPPESP